MQQNGERKVWNSCGRASYPETRTSASEEQATYHYCNTRSFVGNGRFTIAAFCFVFPCDETFISPRHPSELIMMQRFLLHVSPMGVAGNGYPRHEFRMFRTNTSLFCSSLRFLVVNTSISMIFLKYLFWLSMSATV
jgi:hypothetical protein